MENNQSDKSELKAADLELEKIISEINNETYNFSDESAIDTAEVLSEAETDEAKYARRTTTADKAKMELFDWLQCVVGAVIIGIIIFVFIGRTIGVDGISMMNTLRHNDRIIMSNLFYTPQNGDIIVFQTGCEAFGGSPLVKRVIAIEGQTIYIDFECGRVYVDGILQCEPYIFEPTHTRANFVGPFTVSPGHVFVMGDNRNHSTDSRDSRIGEIDTRTILGKVLFVAIPGPEGDGNASRNWSRFGRLETPDSCYRGQDCACDNYIECTHE